VLCTRIFSRLLILAVVLITTHSAFADDRRNRQLRQLNRHLEKLDHHHIEKLANRAARINRGRDKRNKRLGVYFHEVVGTLR
jgi:hypothetical protein